MPKVFNVSRIDESGQSRRAKWFLERILFHISGGDVAIPTCKCLIR